MPGRRIIMAVPRGGNSVALTLTSRGTAFRYQGPLDDVPDDVRDVHRPAGRRRPRGSGERATCLSCGPAAASTSYRCE